MRGNSGTRLTGLGLGLGLGLLAPPHAPRAQGCDAPLQRRLDIPDDDDSMFVGRKMLADAKGGL